MLASSAAWLPPMLLASVWLVLHWPGGASFKADDFPAIRYASQLGNCLQDFFGPQYGLAFFVFYRPLITLSFGIDHLLFGTEPFGYFAMNALAFLASTLVLYSILRLLWPARGGALFAFLGALLWLVHPTVVTSLRWAAGRVDTHVALPLLLALWFHLRARRGGPRWPVWVIAAVALMTKESAIGFPLLALGLDLVDPHPSVRPAPALAGRSLPALPYLLLIPVFFGFRKLVLGRFLGGYGFMALASFDPLATLHGFWNTLGGALLPHAEPALRHAGAAALVLLAALWVLARGHGRMRRLCGLLLVTGGLYGPLLQLMPSMRDPGNQRYAYLAGVLALLPWAGVAAITSRRHVFAGLAIGLLPLAWLLPDRAEERARLDAHDRFNGLVIALARSAAQQLEPDEPVVLAGEAELANHPQRFLWGLGSILKPPFWSPAREVVSLRALHHAASPVAEELIADCLPLVLEVHERQFRLVTSVEPRRLKARLSSFDGVLDREDVERVGRLDPAVGYELGAGFDGEIAVCTSLGSLAVAWPPGPGTLSVPRLLASNATAAAGGVPLPVASLLWNAMDLAKDSPIHLFWREDEGVVCARLRFTPAFTRALQEALGG